MVTLKDSVTKENLLKAFAGELIGGTPILKLNRYSAKEGIQDVTLLAKLEYLNPSEP